MKKFKVGDRVEHRSSVTGSVADVLPSGNYYVRLDRPAFPGDDCMWAFGESELSPLAPIPDGWTPADEPKPDARVRYAVTREGKPDGYDFDKENCYRTYDDAVTSAKKNFYDGDKQHVEVWKLVAIVNPPAEPEVVKLEETMEWVVIVESTNDIIDRFSTYEEAFAVACDFTKRYEQAVIRLEE